MSTSDHAQLWEKGKSWSTLPWFVNALSMITLTVYYCILAPRDVCIRLLPDKNKFFTGSIELNIDGEWGSICYNHWTNEDARVACKQLGFPYTGNL